MNPFAVLPRGMSSNVENVRHFPWPCLENLQLFLYNYKLQRPSARWHVVRDNVFRYSRSLAATCSHSSGRKWPQVAAGASDRPHLPSDRKWPQVTAEGKWPQVTASGRRRQVAASDRKWPQRASGREWPSGRLFQFQIPHLTQPLCLFLCRYDWKILEE